MSKLVSVFTFSRLVKTGWNHGRCSRYKMIEMKFCQSITIFLFDSDDFAEKRFTYISWKNIETFLCALAVTLGCFPSGTGTRLQKLRPPLLNACISSKSDHGSSMHLCLNLSGAMGCVNWHRFCQHFHHKQERIDFINATFNSSINLLTCLRMIRWLGGLKVL